jgi:glycosyltransferase involved in cell wall biosynthesis
MKILITAPSLNENETVSGISSVVRQIVERGTFKYLHFEAGRRDGEPADAAWMLRQATSALRFRRRLKNERVDIVHINTNFNPLAVARDAVFARIARIAGIPIVMHVHGGRFLAEEFQSGWLKKTAEKMLRRARVVIVLSELEKEILESRWKKLNIKILENAVPVEEFPNIEKKNLVPVLIFLGRLHESKGLHEIIEACLILKNEEFNFRFRCFGAGEQKDFFAGEMNKILGEDFYYGGVISGAEKMKALAESDIFLLPSRYGEGLPMALLEAMAAGCIPVVSEMASTGAVVRDGVNGFLIEPQSAAQLSAKLKFLLTDKADWEVLRRNARKTVEEKFNLKDYIKKLEDIYSQAAKNL